MAGRFGKEPCLTTGAGEGDKVSAAVVVYKSVSVGVWNLSKRAAYCFESSVSEESIDGLAIRNANRGNSRESNRTNRFAKKPLFSSQRAIRANRLKTAIRNFSPPKCDSQKRGSVREPRDDSRESSDSRESPNRFARIGPSKEEIPHWFFWQTR